MNGAHVVFMETSKVFSIQSGEAEDEDLDDESEENSEDDVSYEDASDDVTPSYDDDDSENDVADLYVSISAYNAQEKGDLPLQVDEVVDVLEKR